MITIENYLAEAGMFVGLAGILAGFSLTAVIQLLTSSLHGRLATTAVVVFSASSLIFLYGLIVAMVSFAAAAELNRIPTELDSMNAGAFLSLIAAVYVFIGGVGLTGWLRSRATGIVTTIFSLLAACLITYAIVNLISLFV